MKLKMTMMAVVIMAMISGTSEGKSIKQYDLNLNVTTHRARREEAKDKYLWKRAHEDYDNLRQTDPDKYSFLSHPARYDERVAWLNERVEFYKNGWKTTYSDEAATRHEDRRRTDSRTSNVGWYCPSNIALTTTQTRTTTPRPTVKTRRNKPQMNIMDELPPDVRAFFANATDIHIR